MKFPIRSQLSGQHGLVPVFARRLTPLLLIVVAQASMKDTIGSELISRVDVQHDSLGDLGDASADVGDAPEQLDLPAPPKAQPLTHAELALVQAKVSHKEQSKKATHKRKAKRHLVHKKQPAQEANQAIFGDEAPQIEKSQSLAKVWEKSTKQEAKSADADVDQLGGQLTNIMSELNDVSVADKKQDAPVAPVADAPVADDDAPVVEKEQDDDAPVAETQQDDDAPVAVQQTSRKAVRKVVEQPKVVEQASLAEDGEDTTPDSGDDASIEKEAGEAVKSVDSQKDDSENVVDGAMAYIRTRLSAEEHKSLRLRQLLQQSVRGNRKMRQKVEQIQKQLTQGASLQKSLRGASTQKIAQEDAELAKQKKLQNATAQQLQNATLAAKTGEKSMKFLSMKLKYAKSQVTALLLNLANASQQNSVLRRQLDSTNATEHKESKLLGEARKKMSAEEKELAETKAALAKLQAAKSAEDAKFTTMDRQKDLLEQRQASATKRDKILHSENTLLKKQLRTEIQREEQLRQMWSKESEAFTWQLRAERANASESLSDLEKARAEFRDLRVRVQKLRSRASDGDKKRHTAQDAAGRLNVALAEADAENKQLKGTVPWLQGEVDRLRFASQNATQQATQASKERDTVKAILGEAQKNIVQLQGQYADALQALVVAQAGPQSAREPGPTNSIQEFAGLGGNLLGDPPPSTPMGFPQVAGASDGSSLLELRRDSTSLNGFMDNVPAPVRSGRVDLSKDSGGLSALLRGMKGS